MPIDLAGKLQEGNGGGHGGVFCLPQPVGEAGEGENDAGVGSGEWKIVNG
jgi:hypothetical protein